MATTLTHIPVPDTHRSRLREATPPVRWRLAHIVAILGLWLAIFAASVASPPLLDDADATHAQAAQAMLSTGDFVTLHVDGIRYLEKAPLPYWITALSLRVFTSPRTLTRRAAFAVHLPLALTVLGLALLGYAWSRRAFGERAALYTAMFTLTSAGVFLFTRIFIPDALLSLLLAAALYSFLRALDGEGSWRPSSQNRDVGHPQDAATERVAPHAASGMWAGKGLSRTGAARLHAHLLWLFLALAVLTKGLVALVLFFGTALLFMAATRALHRWRALAPLTGGLLLLVVAAPWHILAGLRNTGGAGGHGFFWFYFVNEHVLRFLGERIPRDYNKLPGPLYWSLHLVWLFPWSLFAPAAMAYAAAQSPGALSLRAFAKGWGLVCGSKRPISCAEPVAAAPRLRSLVLTRGAPPFAKSGKGWGTHNDGPDLRGRTALLLGIFSTLVLVFFSLSTNQEYYTFPAYLPLLMLLAAALAGAEQETRLRPWLGFGYAALMVLGGTIAVALGCGLWAARGLPYGSDIGSLLAHRGVGNYTLSMSHFFDLTGPSFAALRLPSMIAAAALAIGPAIAFTLHRRHKAQAAMVTVAMTSACFLVAAHIALVRFAPMLSSEAFATTIQQLERSRQVRPGSEVMLYGDQAFGSSIPFYLQRQVVLVDGRSTSMLFGSTFADAAPVFVTASQLSGQWGSGPRKLLFVPQEQRDAVDRLLGSRAILLREISGKALYTDRPLEPNATL